MFSLYSHALTIKYSHLIMCMCFFYNSWDFIELLLRISCVLLMYMQRILYSNVFPVWRVISTQVLWTWTQFPVCFRSWPCSAGGVWGADSEWRNHWRESAECSLPSSPCPSHRSQQCRHQVGRHVYMYMHELSHVLYSVVFCCLVFLYFRVSWALMYVYTWMKLLAFYSAEWT